MVVRVGRGEDMDIREAVRKNLEIAKAALAMDKFLASVTLLIKEDGSTLPVPHKGDEGEPMEVNKSRIALTAGVMARVLGADMVVMVWDAAFRTVDAKDKDDLDETDAPLTYPKSMRTECVIVHGIDLRDGGTHIDMAPYKGGDGEPVEFLPKDEKWAEAEFSTRFDDLIRKGYGECSRRT